MYTTFRCNCTDRRLLKAEMTELSMKFFVHMLILILASHGSVTITTESSATVQQTLSRMSLSGYVRRVTIFS